MSGEHCKLPSGVHPELLWHFIAEETHINHDTLVTQLLKLTPPRPVFTVTSEQLTPLAPSHQTLSSVGDHPTCHDIGDKCSTTESSQLRRCLFEKDCASDNQLQLLSCCGR